MARTVLPRDAPPAPAGGWGVAELHSHTSASDGVPSPEELVRTAARLGIDVLAITDHDTIRGALRAREYAERTNAPVEIVVGMEVTTLRQDHVIGLFLKRPVPIFRPLVETVKAIQSQGGLAIVAHPFLGVPSSISQRRLAAALGQVRVDGIEIENQYMRASVRARVRAFLAQHGDRLGAQVGGTDAHFGDLGKAMTLFSGRRAIDLRRALEDGQTVAARGGTPHPRPGLRAHATNQFRSLVKLPIMRLGILARQLAGR